MKKILILSLCLLVSCFVLGGEVHAQDGSSDNDMPRNRRDKMMRIRVEHKAATYTPSSFVDLALGVDNYPDCLTRIDGIVVNNGIDKISLAMIKDGKIKFDLAWSASERGPYKLLLMSKNKRVLELENGYYQSGDKLHNIDLTSYFEDFLLNKYVKNFPQTFTDAMLKSDWKAYARDNGIVLILANSCSKERMWRFTAELYSAPLVTTLAGVSKTAGFVTLK